VLFRDIAKLEEHHFKQQYIKALKFKEKENLMKS